MHQFSSIINSMTNVSSHLVLPQNYLRLCVNGFLISCLLALGCLALPACFFFEDQTAHLLAKQFNNSQDENPGSWASTIQQNQNTKLRTPSQHWDIFMKTASNRNPNKPYINNITIQSTKTIQHTKRQNNARTPNTKHQNNATCETPKQCKKKKH